MTNDHHLTEAADWKTTAHRNVKAKKNSDAEFIVLLNEVYLNGQFNFSANESVDTAHLCFFTS